MDAPKVLPCSAHFGSHETCFNQGGRGYVHEMNYPATDSSGARTSTMIMLRSPRAHVLSQYLMCRYSKWGRRMTAPTWRPSGAATTAGHSNHSRPQQATATTAVGAAFPRSNRSNWALDFHEWLEHFVNGSAWAAARSRDIENSSALQGGPAPGLHNWGSRAEWERTHADFHCYNPNNMMARALACPSGEYQSPHHCYSSRECNEQPPPLELALRSLEKSRFVGLTERYDDSLCLLRHLSGGGAKSSSCANVTSSSHHSHGVPRHDVRTLPAETLALVDQLTAVDAQLYARAEARFARDLAASPCERRV